MLKRTALILISIIALVSTNAIAESPLKIHVFHDSNSTITHTQTLKGNAVVSVYDLSEATRLEDEISFNLSSDPEKAQQQAMARLKKGGKALENRIIQSHMPAMKALELGLKKLPAIVFNDEAVIYGETNVLAAYNKYKQHISRRK